MIKEVSLKDLKDYNINKSNNPFTKYIAYIKENEIYGYIEYNDIYETIDIVNVFVKEKYRNKKIGDSLIKYLIKNSNNKQNITLEVNSQNEIAIKLYKNNGFKKVAIREGYYNGTDGYLMELKL